MSARDVRVLLRGDARAFNAALTRASDLTALRDVVARLAGRAAHWTRHHPPSLGIDGHAYHRRTRNRRKRR